MISTDGLRVSPPQSHVVVDLKVLLPTQEVVSVAVRKNASTVDVYRAVVVKTGMQPETAKSFALFEIVEYHFGECGRVWSTIISVSVGGRGGLGRGRFRSRIRSHRVTTERAAQAVGSFGTTV